MDARPRGRRRRRTPGPGRSPRRHRARVGARDGAGHRDLRTPWRRGAAERARNVGVGLVASNARIASSAGDVLPFLARRLWSRWSAATAPARSPRRTILAPGAARARRRHEQRRRPPILRGGRRRARGGGGRARRAPARAAAPAGRRAPAAAATRACRVALKYPGCAAPDLCGQARVAASPGKAGGTGGARRAGRLVTRVHRKCLGADFYLGAAPRGRRKAGSPQLRLDLREVSFSSLSCRYREVLRAPTAAEVARNERGSTSVFEIAETR